MDSPFTLDAFINDLRGVREEHDLGAAPFGFYLVRSKERTDDEVVLCELVECRPLGITRLYTQVAQPFMGLILDRVKDGGSIITHIQWANRGKGRTSRLKGLVEAHVSGDADLVR